MDRSQAREFMRGSSFAFVGSIASKALNYAFLLVGVRVLSESAFGAYVFIFAILNLVQRFGMLGINKCIDYYVPHFLQEGDRRSSRSVLLTAVSLIVLMGLFLGVVVTLLSGILTRPVDHPDAGTALLMLGISLPVYMYLTALRDSFHAVKQIGTRVIINSFLYPGLQPLLLVILGGLGFGLLGAAGAFIGAVTVAASLGTVAFLWWNTWVLDREIELFDLRRIFEYSFPMTASVITAAIIGQIDILLLGVFVPTVDVGFYRLAFSVAMLPTIVPPMLRSILKPLVAESQQDLATIRDLYRQSSRWVILLSMPITLTLLVAPARVIDVLFGEGYGGGTLTPTVLILGQVVMMGLGSHSTFLQGLGRTRPIFYSKVAALLINGVVDLLLIPQYGILGAAIGASAGSVAGAVLRSLSLYRHDGVHPLSGPFVRAIVAAGPVYIVATAIDYGSGILWLILLGGIVTSSYGVTSLLFGAVSSEDISFVEIIEESLGIDLELLKLVIGYRAP